MLYRWKEDNICQSIWDKMKCYGKHVNEHIGNLGNIFETWWEPIQSLKGTGEKWKKILPPPAPPAPKLKRKNKIHWMHVWSFPLVAWNFFSKKHLSQFWPKLIPLAKSTLPIVQCLIEIIIFHHSLWSQNVHVEAYKTHY
jgi:hypothetical protein